MEKLLRNFFLFMARNNTLNKLAQEHGLRFGGRRFVAGETLISAIDSVRSLNNQGLMVTFAHLGEFVNNADETGVMTDGCLETLEAISEHSLNANLSLKLTSMGLDISRDLCLKNMERVLQKARQYNIFVRIDMEDYIRLDSTLELFYELRESYDNVGLVIQSYLYRSLEDVKALNKYKTNLRIVKGAYKESPEVAFPEKKDVDENFKQIIKVHLENGNYTAVATHDKAIIAYTKKLIKEKKIPVDQFEYQMLYGICPELQRTLVEEGYRVRTYVPFGKDWYGYFMRRLAERPANVGFVLKGMFKR